MYPLEFVQLVWPDEYQRARLEGTNQLVGGKATSQQMPP